MQTGNSIYIIGAGTVGKVLAVFLKLNKKNVIILRGSVDDKPAYTENIQVLLNGKTEIEAEIEINTLSNVSALNGIVLLTNKSYGNLGLSRTLKEKINNSPIVILQNGLGVEQPFIDTDFPAIYRCVLFMTGQNISVNKISYKPVAVSQVGIIKGNEAELTTIVEQINSSNFQFRSENNIQPVIWKKAIMNSVFNSICPLLDIDNGIFHRDERVFNMAKRVVEECVTIAREKGILINVDEVLQGVLLISKSSDGQLISTLQDINNRKKTEIETLNFEIARIAKSLGMESAVTETKLLGELTKLKSELSMAQNPV